MPASMPNLSSIHTMGAQFKTNIFAKASSSAYEGAGKLGQKAKAAKAAAGPGTPTQFPKTFSPASPTDAPLSTNAVAEGRARRQAKAGYTPASAQHAAPNFGPASVAKGHALERGATPPTHAAPSFSSPKAASVGAPSFSHAPQAATPNPANIFRSDATRATPSFSDVNKMSSGSSALSSPAPSTTPFHAPDNTQSQQFSNSKGSGGGESTPGRVDVSTKDNSPFPTHVHPENSSNLNLHDLSRKISTLGKPNPVTMGSRSIKGGGIASMGSQLEEGLATRPLSLPPKRKRI